MTTDTRQAASPSQRIEALRKRRKELGLKRRELYAHDDDWPAVQALAVKMQRKRERKR